MARIYIPARDKRKLSVKIETVATTDGRTDQIIYIYILATCFGFAPEKVLIMYRIRVPTNRLT